MLINIEEGMLSQHCRLFNKPGVVAKLMVPPGPAHGDCNPDRLPQTQLSVTDSSQFLRLGHFSH